MICNDKYIFVHVPKTGGHSITAALGSSRHVKWLESGERSSYPDMRCGTAECYEKHEPLHLMKRRGRFAFGFVRNPWSRMVSLYRFHCQKTFRPTDAFDQEATRAMGFGAWLMTDQFYMKQDKGRDMPPMQRRPQMWWLDGADFIGRVENIEQDFARALALSGAVAIEPLGHINTTTGGDWRAEYDAESSAFVAKHFAPDIERFGYTPHD